MKTLFALLMMSLAFTANAEDSRDLTFEEFQESCKNPSRYGHQNPPSKIKLLCHDVYNAWQPIESGFVKLAESRMVSSELFSNKYHVSSTDFGIEVPERNAVCPRFREVVQTVTLEFAQTCDDLTGEEVSLKDICKEAIDKAVADNPDIVNTTPSGRQYSVCGDATQKP